MTENVYKRRPTQDDQNCSTDKSMMYWRFFVTMWRIQNE